MDIDFDDLDGPSKAPASKPGKFAPKKSKFKPAAKPQRQPEAPVELDDSKGIDSVEVKTEAEPPLHTTVPSSHDDRSSAMDIDDVTEMEVDNDGEQDKEDEVVREIDVFLTSSVDAHSKLYVLQYPLRPSWRPYELEERCEKVKWKPETAEVEVEMSVRDDSENYDPIVDDDKAMKKEVLSTAWKPLPTTGYAVGILMGNQLHLNPVHAVVQLRPSLQNLKDGHLSKKMNKTHDEVNNIASVDATNEKAIKQSKKQSKLPGAVNEQNEDNREQWISLKYHGAESQSSHQCMKKMVAEHTSQIQFSMSLSDYIDSFSPVTSDQLRPKFPSRSSLLKLPLEERYKRLLLEGPPVHRFNALKHLAPDDSDEDIFRVLQNLAQLVQGLWVAKSRLKYGKDVGKEVLLRNYALLQFSKNPIFHEAQLPKSTSVSETMKGILDEFAARRDSCRDWKFKEPTDDAFIKQHPSIVEEQKKIWDRAEPQIVEVLFQNSSTHGIIGDRRATSNSAKDDAQKSTNVPPFKMLDETRDVLPKALQKLFQVHKVCSLNQIRQRLRDMAVSESIHRKETRDAKAAAAAADPPLEELQKTLNQIAVDIHGVYVLRSSPDHPQYDELRNIVINLFLAEGPKGRLKKASIFAAANMQLKREITNIEYQKVLSELCISQNSAWVLKSGDGSPT